MLPSPSKTLLRTQSDERLVRLAAAGSEAAFAVIVERHSRLLARACRRVLPEARVDDAVQQAFVAAWSALRRGVEVRELRPWLLRIARNTALNALRVPGYDYEVLRESLQVTEAPPAELERMEVIRATLAGMAELPESQREALLSSAVHGTPHAEIARDLGVSEGAVRQLVLRARITLRAAATAITPLPLAEWLASPAGGAAILAKTSAVVVLAGGAAAGPTVAERIDRYRAPEPAVAVAAPPGGASSEPAVVPAPEAGAVDLVESEQPQ